MTFFLKFWDENQKGESRQEWKNRPKRDVHNGVCNILMELAAGFDDVIKIIGMRPGPLEVMVLFSINTGRTGKNQRQCRGHVAVSTFSRTYLVQCIVTCMFLTTCSYYLLFFFVLSIPVLINPINNGSCPREIYLFSLVYLYLRLYVGRVTLPAPLPSFNPVAWASRRRIGSRVTVNILYVHSHTQH